MVSAAISKQFSQAELTEDTSSPIQKQGASSEK